jgi:hypothetical protein
VNLFQKTTRIVGIGEPRDGFEGYVAEESAQTLHILWDDAHGFEQYGPNQALFVPKDSWLRAQKLYHDSQAIFEETKDTSDDPATWVGNVLLGDFLVMDGRPLPVHLAVALWAYFVRKDLNSRERKERVDFAVILLRDGSVEKVPYHRPSGYHPDSCKAMELAAESARKLGLDPAGVYKRDMDIYNVCRGKALPKANQPFEIILAMRASA